MTNELRNYFPMLRTREEVLREIWGNEKLLEVYEGWQEDQQEEFLDFCSGARGVKMLYDFAAKELLNPEVYPDRLGDLLSVLLRQRVKVLSALPNDSGKLGDGTTLVIMDIVVMLEDGSIANIEIQRIGYNFPGQRCACYSADLLLRQYKRVRGEKKKQFSYRDIKTVYTIVLFEKSTVEFRAYPGEYLHCFRQVSDTGAELDLLQKYVFVPLDIFRKNLHNKGIH